ncbi:hypothetical protein ACA910_021038 [Epithemia clementina (nom. ined.)]
MNEPIPLVVGERDSSRHLREELWASQLSFHNSGGTNRFLNQQPADSFCEDWSQFVGDDEEEEDQAETSSDKNVQFHRTTSSRGRGSGETIVTLPRERDESKTNDNTYDDDNNILIELPPSLHPAVSAGMKRISSCYYSIHSTSTNNSTVGLNHQSSSTNGSLVDILAFLDCQNSDEGSLGSLSAQRRASFSSLNSTMSDQQQQEQWSGGLVDDLLYHDILMNVFTYLDIDSLASFSETALRPNFEVFYYLQLQLQRSLLLSPVSSDHGLSPIKGTSRLTRLARAEYKRAEQIVQGYLDSNTSLKQMPLSHSLEYIRQVLMRQRLLLLNKINKSTNQQAGASSGQDTSIFSGAALLIALIGAASFMNSDSMMAMNVDSFMPPAAELPNMLFRVGFVGSLMSAVRSYAASNKNGASQNPNSSQGSHRGGDMKHRAALMKQQAEQFANNMMHAFTLLLANGGNIDAEENHNGSMAAIVRGIMIRMMRAAYSTAYGRHHQLEAGGFFSSKRAQHRQRPNLVSPNPYDHLPETVKEEEDNDFDDTALDPAEKIDHAREETGNVDDASVQPADHGNNHGDGPGDNDEVPPGKQESSDKKPIKKTPTGCVGAYRRAISQVNKRLVELVKDERLRKYKERSDEEQRTLGTMLLDACASDDGLDNVKTIIEGGIDVEDFYVSGDGTETSPLHAAAFHGASCVLEYLCRGLQDDDGYDQQHEDPQIYDDGGLCQVNLKDPNGWTALHFAAGTNSTKCIQILVQYGADLTIEAANGYTPLQWAMRLQNSDAADALRELLSKQDARRKKSKPLDLSRLLFDNRGGGS